MNTKEKILTSAIDLYNRHGLNNITSRHIANEIGISHGNLEYHFPTKEKILEAIYVTMREKADSLYSSLLDEGKDPYLSFQELLEGLVCMQQEFRFFNQDVLDIFRKYEKVNLLLKETLQIREKQILDLWDKFEELGLLEKEIRKGSYARTRHSIRILLTFWNSQETVLSQTLVPQYNNLIIHIWDLIYPFMTNKGIEKYNSLKIKL